MAGLLVYLAGPGRANEHSEPHLVAGDGAVMAWHDDAELDRDSALQIAKHLDGPHKVFDTHVKDGHVWHCSMSLRAEEGQLSDAKWGQIANEFMEKMGWADDGVKAPIRWAAVRHGLSSKGNDHIHLVVDLVREDGTKANINEDWSRVSRACRELEQAHGLQPVMARHRGRGSRGYTRGELMAAARRQAIDTYLTEGQKTPWAQLPRADREARVSDAAKTVELPRYGLRRRIRGVAATSRNEAEFVRRVRASGLLIRPRFASGRHDVVTGYSVAFRPEPGQEPFWYGGGETARDLTLPRLREQWPDTPADASEAVAEWQAAWRGKPVVNPGPESLSADPDLWARCEADLAGWRQALRDVPVGDRAAWATVARDAAGAFAAWSAQVETTPGPLAETSDALARSAELRRSVERPRPAGQVGAYGAAMLLAVASSNGKSLVAQAMILRQLVNLVKALHDMHQADGDAQRASELVSVVHTQLAEVSARLPDPDTVLTPGNADPRDPRDPDPRDPRDAEVEVEDIEIEVEDPRDATDRDDDLAPDVESQGQTPQDVASRWVRTGSGPGRDETPQDVASKWVRKGTGRRADSEAGQAPDPTLAPAGGDTEPLASPLPGTLERDEQAEEALATARQGQVPWEYRDPSEVSNDDTTSNAHTRSKSNERDDDGRG